MMSNNLKMKTMKRILATIILALFANVAFAQTRFDLAKQEATEKNEMIVLNFSGSDWCIPCIKLHKNFIETETFQKLISDHVIVYLNADFPRSKKNQPIATIKKENAALADQYNPNGVFPYTILMDNNGKILKTWDGLPSEDALSFTSEIKTEHQKIFKN